MAQQVAHGPLSATRLWSVARAQLAGLMSSFDEAEVLLRERTLLGLSGGPTADFNMCLVDDSPHVESAVSEAVERTAAQGFPAIFMFSVLASERLGGAERFGLTKVGEAPLMLLEGPPPPAQSRFAVAKVSTEPEMQEVAGLIAAAFALDLGWVGRTFASHEAIETSCATDFYLVKADGDAVSTVTVTGAGSVLGIWSMATAPEFQRRGAGRAALVGAMTAKRALGARAFYLIATPAGKPLYDAVGFTTVETVPMYVLGPHG